MFSIAIAISAFVAYALTHAAPDRYSHAYVTAALLLTTASIVLHVQGKRRHGIPKNVLGLDVVFLIGFMIVNFTTVLYVYSGAVSAHAVQWRVPVAKYFMESTMGATLGISGFCCGFAGAMDLHRFQAGSRRWWSAQPFSISLRHAVLLSFTGGILLAFFLVRNRGTYFGGTYSGVSDIPEIDTIAFTLSQIALTVSAAFSVIVMLKNGADDFARCVLTQVPWFVLLLAMFIHGDRGGIIQNSGPVFFLIFLKTPRRLLLPLSVFGLILLLAALAVVRVVRQQARGGPEVWSNAIVDSQPSDLVHSTLENVGYSGQMLLIAVRHTRQNGYFHGVFMRDSVLAAIPFSRRFISRLGIGRTQTYRGSTDLLSTIVHGRTRSTGTGTSSTADLYFDFAWPGVFFGHLFVGYIAAICTPRSMLQFSDDRRLALYLAVIGFFAIMARYNAISMTFRHILYSAAIIYAVTRILPGARLR